ncbi:PREDICTED: uncharacterized protein C16orf78 homolog [Miniopterus natalensis]|uniref:uncharacterized protein C16orf78 homolog n=1 Tax=Miniopterus natalensis TaxID=291302 RepID=UPI0007A6B6DC|nr:PREDICTED: uncharacterized protein C16orf78 homolog [Miniopterus natalensis]
MSEKPEDPKDLMPTERKSMWRTAEERRMSDLTRVMEWLERRRGKQQALQKHTKVAPVSKAPGKEEKKAKVTKKKSKDNRQVSFSAQPTGSSSRKDGDPVRYRRLYGMEMKGKRLSIVPGNYSKEALGKSEIDIKESIVQDSTQRLMSFHRQSMADPLMLQDPVFTGRRSTILRDWVGKIPESSYDRRLKNLMDKGTDPKVEMVKTLKPEEVLSCRYLRLSKNNVLTLLKLCKDAGLVVDIHPHMVESEIDAKKVFAPHPTVAL